MLTPQMRFHFYDNARKLDATELTDLKTLAMRHAPASVHSLENGEVKIDIDRMEMRSFMVMDTFARKIVAAREPPR